MGRYSITIAITACYVIWVYLVTAERTGLLRLSVEGREIAFYDVDADFDMLSARLTTAGNRLYFLVAGPEETAVYTVAVP